DMAKYIHYDYAQGSMIAINFENQLQPGTFEYAVHYLVDHKLNVSSFAATFHNDDCGRPAYDPARVQLPSATPVVIHVALPDQKIEKDKP
ncbi:MAG: hypothetical protein Q9M25_06645, partial [Mariprofundaceae bacterium]|nr:hypothetical protein [Mariprofundaceae bacterium]